MRRACDAQARAVRPSETVASAQAHRVVGAGGSAGGARVRRAGASDDEPARDVLYRYDAAVFGALFYLLILGIVLVIASGLDPREAFALRRPTSWGLAAGLAVGLLVTLLIVSAVLEPLLGAGEEQGLDPSGWRPSAHPRSR